MLIDNLVRLGRIATTEGVDAVGAIRAMTDVSNPSAARYYQHVFVVEISDADSGRPRIVAHPFAVWGEEEPGRKRPTFRTDTARAVGAPVVLPRGGSPRAAQGRYPVPAYIVLEGDFKEFAGKPQAVFHFLRARLDRTLGQPMDPTWVEQIADALSTRFADVQPERGVSLSGLILLADTTARQPYFLATEGRTAEGIVVGQSRLTPGAWILADPECVLKRVLEAKAEEGAEFGRIRDGKCTLCGRLGEVVSVYSKAWPWFTTTWTAPLPMELPEERLVEAIGLCHACYVALAYGANQFRALARWIPSWLVHELFSPAADYKGSRGPAGQSAGPRIAGVALALPVADDVPDESVRADLAEGLACMAASAKRPQADLHLDSILGLEALLPVELQSDVYRLTVVYYSGDETRGDIHLRATIEDVLPSVVSQVDRWLRETYDDVEPVIERWVVGKTAESTGFIRTRFRSLPYLLGRAYGAPYLWETLTAVLSRRPLSRERFLRNAALRITQVARHLPDTYYDMREEVLFYLTFRQFLMLYEPFAMGEGKGRRMRPWRELQRCLLERPVAELEFEDAEEMGFLAGHLIRLFSYGYWHQKGRRTGEPGAGGSHSEPYRADFLKERVMTFGSSLTPDAVYRRALRQLPEIGRKLGIRLGLDAERRLAVLLSEMTRRHPEIEADRDAFMAAFWAGYALADQAREAGPAPDAEETEEGEEG